MSFFRIGRKMLVKKTWKFSRKLQQKMPAKVGNIFPTPFEEKQKFGKRFLRNCKHYLLLLRKRKGRQFYESFCACLKSAKRLFRFNPSPTTLQGQE
jgi:hypothetical protein